MQKLRRNYTIYLVLLLVAYWLGSAVALPCAVKAICADGNYEICPDGSPLANTNPPCSGGAPRCADGSSPICPSGTPAPPPPPSNTDSGSLPTLPPPNNQQNTANDDDDDNAVLIASVSAAAGVVLIVIIVVLLVVLLNSKKKDEKTEVQPVDASASRSVEMRSEGDSVQQPDSSVQHKIKQWETTLPSQQGQSNSLGQSTFVTVEMQNASLPHPTTSSSDVPPGHSSVISGSLLEDGALMTEASAGGYAAGKQAQINDGDYQKVKLIGRGANGAVYSCLLGDGSYVAMKEVFLQEENMRQMVKEVEKEIVVIEEIKHPNVVSYYAAKFVEREHTLLVFMELVTGGSLGSMVRNMQEPLREKTAQRYVRRIVEGLAHIHSKGVVHRDLKCDNILMTTEGQVKIADFGTAKNVAGGGGTARGAQTMIGTPFFMAPEILLGADDDDSEQGSGGYGRAADVWSLGVTVGELLNQGNPPWPPFANPGQAFLHISSDKGIPIVPSHASPDAKDFILQCCIRDPRKRPKSADLLKHSWLNSELSSMPPKSES